MQPFKIVVGIDVAQDSLAVSIYDGKSHEVLEFDYTQTAIRKNLLNRFKKEKESVVFVMEATGIYHTKLAYMLCENTFKISVLNPFVIKKYAEMNLMRVKTDSVDAKLIAQYGYEYQNKLLFYKLKSDARVHVDNIIKAIDDLLQQKTMSKNQHHALKQQAHHSKDILSSYDRHIKFISKEIIKLEKLLEGLQPKLIQSNAMMISKINYIHHNPVKRGYIDLPSHWRYSSARDYEGISGLVEIERFW